MALVSAWVMKVILQAKEKSYFIMELPTYKAPRFKHMAISILNSVKAFVFEAGKIILAISIVLWFQKPECSVKKGSVWWLRSRLRHEGDQSILVTVQSPDMLQSINKLFSKDIFRLFNTKEPIQSVDGGFKSTIILVFTFKLFQEHHDSKHQIHFYCFLHELLPLCLLYDVLGL